MPEWVGLGTNKKKLYFFFTKRSCIFPSYTIKQCNFLQMADRPNMAKHYHINLYGIPDKLTSIQDLTSLSTKNTRRNKEDIFLVKKNKK